LRHLFPSNRVTGLLDADRALTAEEVEERRRRYGSNDIIGDKQLGWGAIARDTAQDPMVWFLIATALLFAWLGDYAEASILGLALLPIAGMDAYLHRRTQATTESLAGRLAASARVIRDGVIKDIPAVELVVGDLSSCRRVAPFPPTASSWGASTYRPMSRP
jgi:P-type Ca2+ transporter type 2C